MRWTEAGAALLLGTVCVGCDRPGRPWCERCEEDLQAQVDPVARPEDPVVVGCCRYDGRVPAAIVGFKDLGVTALRTTLGHIVAAGVVTLLADSTARPLLVPAPSSPAALRRRAFDHTWEVAAVAARTLDLPAQRVLRSRWRRDQAGLSRVARGRNLAGSMRVAVPGSGSVVVVDDVRTSGATLAECQRALVGAGYVVIGHVVIACAV